MSQNPASESMTLSRFVSEYKDRLPQAVAVTIGKEDTVRGGISSGEKFVACFLKTTRVVNTQLHLSDSVVSIPINSKLKFAPIPDDHEKTDTWEGDITSIAQLLAMECLPKAMKVTKSCESSANKLDSKRIVVSAGTILINVKKIKIRSGLSIKNGIKCTSINGVKHFFTDGEKVSFTSSRHSILMSVYEFCDHIHYPVKAEVYMIDGKEEAVSLNDRSIVTFLGCREETSLVIKVEQKGESKGLIYSIPVDWDIEVQCVRLESEENVYEEIQGHKQMIRNASNSHIGVQHPDLYAYVNMTIPNIASRDLEKLPAPRPRRMVKHLVDHFEHGNDPSKSSRKVRTMNRVTSRSLEVLPTHRESSTTGKTGDDSDTDYEEMEPGYPSPIANGKTHRTTPSKSEDLKKTSAVTSSNKPAHQVDSIQTNISRLRSLSTTQISKLLTSLGMEEHVDQFKREEIDGDLLADMNDACLEDVGIKKSLHRLKLRKFISGEKPLPPNIL